MRTGSRERFLFIHVMKTGGTSFVLHLLKQFPSNESYPSATLDRRHIADAEPYASIADLVALSPERKAEIRVYAGHFPFMVRDLIGPGVVTLSLLRDPVERTVSVLRHFKRHERYQDCSLEEIYEDPFLFRAFVENHQTRVFALTNEDRPIAFASELTFDEVQARLAESGPARDDPSVAIPIDDDRLARAKANLEQVDELGLSEEFHEFIERLQQRFGWWKHGIDDRPRANVSSESWDVGPALRERIARDNAIDIDLYEYGHALVRRRRR